MKNGLKWTLRLVQFSLFYSIPFSSLGQISTHEGPLSFNNAALGKSFRKTENIQTIEMPELNMSKLMEEDKKMDHQGAPFRFGFSFPVKITMNNSGNWDSLIDGTKIWRLKIHLAKGAKSLSFVYNHFYLPQGTRFHIYSEDKKQVLGAYTSQNNKGMNGKDTSGFATSFIFGRNAVLEYQEPKGTLEKPNISISEIIHAYRGVKSQDNLSGGNSTGFPSLAGGSSNCEVNINCPEGLPYQNEKHAVAVITLGGFACTGSLVQNTSRDLTPYLLTANHCLNNLYDAKGNTEISSLVLYWNYESPDCSNTYLPAITTQGGTLVANSPISDFALIKLQENPRTVPGINPSFLDWSRSDQGSPSAAVIHHPFIDIKKISLDNTSPVNAYSGYINWYQTGFGYLNTSFPYTHWSVLFDIGETEGGSSGSPLLDQNHLLIGQLHGGYSANCVPKGGTSYFGRFDISWFGDFTPERSLRTWLDPLGTNAMSSFPVKINGPEFFCTQAKYTAIDVPQGQTVTWSIFPENPLIQLIPNGNTLMIHSEITSSDSIQIRASLNGPSASIPVKISSNSLSGTFTTSDGLTRSLQNVNYIAPGNVQGFFFWPNVKSINMGAVGTGIDFDWDQIKNFEFSVSNGQFLNVEFSCIGDCTGKPVWIHQIKKFIASTVYSLSVSPNPSSGIINLGIQSLVDTTGKLMIAQKEASTSSPILSSPNSTKILIYDLSNGVLVRDWTFNEDLSLNYTLNASRLKPGNYVLKMSRDNRVSSTNIQIL